MTPGGSTDSPFLIADDDEIACQALQELLISLGAKVATANSVDEALAKMGRFHSDLVICDIWMPVRDGISMAREVRRREQDSGGQVRTPLIALTAYGRVDDKIRILNAGFDSHVVKPVELEELSAIIRNLAARA
jgi:two-component system OmpR family response regulator